MWLGFFIGSVCCLILPLAWVKIAATKNGKKCKIFNALFTFTILSVFVAFLPVYAVNLTLSVTGIARIFLMSVFKTIQVFTAGCEFDVISKVIADCPPWLRSLYQAWCAFLFALSPLLTFGFVLSLFKNAISHIRFRLSFFKDMYVFSELNEKSFALAKDIKQNHTDVAVVFADVYYKGEEKMYELIDRAKGIGAITFQKDILLLNFNSHSAKKNIFLFAIGENETENLNQALNIIENYKTRKNTHLYVFSTKIESELLLSTADKGFIKVRRINEVQSLVSRILFEKGNLLFESAKKLEDGIKNISVIVAGMGSHGTEFIKALTWFGQMDGYRIKINAFDKDELAEEKFSALAPELMHSDYNGVIIEGEAQYSIKIHSGVDVYSKTFIDEVNKIDDATFVIIALGNDDVNISTAVTLRTCFERKSINPVIQAIVYNSQQKKALTGIKNYRNQEYCIDFIGDIESSYTENVILNSELENLALERHLKWGEEDEFWTYEYNYRSSVASAIHLRARIACEIPGASKSEAELTIEERDAIEALEHRRWNAYMRAEGYVYSGSKEKESRNDLGKMHNDLIDYSSLSDDEKRKDSKIGTT